MKKALLLLWFVAATATAQTFPSKPVRWIVPFPPGGATDIIARIVAAKMSEAWKEPVVVENRAGAAGAIGSEVVARAAPDGHTILMGTTSTHAVGPAINPKLPYNHLTAHPSTADSLPDLIAKLKTQTDNNHIPYKGTGPLQNDLMAGHVAFAFDQVTAVMSAVNGGKMKALGVASLERSSALPGFEATAWVGIFAPAKTPAEVASRIQTETARIVQLANPPSQFASFVKKDTERWRNLVATAQIKVEQ
jgi:tripartite-type tricarboxylate transporter receptor subunit TctC